jgi:predicted RNA-binding Zn-ribbon protein involved in translation (DUF1610 family)
MTKIFRRAIDIIIDCPNCGKITGYKMVWPQKNKIDCPKCGNQKIDINTIGNQYDLPSHT